MNKVTYIRLKVEDSKNFNSFTVKSIENNVKTIIGTLREGGSKIQSILFPKTKYDVCSAHKWANEHGYNIQETYLVEDIGINPKDFSIYFIEEVYTAPQTYENKSKINFNWLFDTKSGIDAYYNGD